MLSPNVLFSILGCILCVLFGALCNRVLIISQNNKMKIKILSGVKKYPTT
jgi:hypothetical protein